MFVESAGCTLYYEILDLTPPWIVDKETIVFCHGVGTTADVWSDWVAVLAPYYRIVRFDTRGFGRSDPAPPEYSWTMDGLADDILAVAKAAGVDRFHLVGESAGGTASLCLASRQGRPLLTLSCVSTAHRGNDLPLIKDWRQAVKAVGPEAWSLQMMEKRFHPGALPDAKREWYQRTQAESNPDSYLDVGELLLRTDLSAQISNISIPLLLLTPDASPFVSVALSSEICKLVPHAEMAVVPFSKHGLPFSHGRQCAKILRRFLMRH